MKSYNCFFVTAFFHWAGCFQGSSLGKYVSELHPFMWLNNIPPRGTLCSFIHQWMDIYTASTLGKIKNTAINISCISFWVNIFQFSWVYTELLGHLVTLSFSEELPNCSPKMLYHFTFPPATTEGFHFTRCSPTLIFSFKSYPSDCKVLSPYEFHLHFPNYFEHSFI